MSKHIFTRQAAIVGLGISLGIAGCGSLESPETISNPQIPSGRLDSALSYSELPERQKSIDLPEAAKGTRIDLRSTVYITPNVEKLKEIASGVTPLTPEEEIRFEALSKVERAVATYRRTGSSVEKVLRQLSKTPSTELLPSVETRIALGETLKSDATDLRDAVKGLLDAKKNRTGRAEPISLIFSSSENSSKGVVDRIQMDQLTALLAEERAVRTERVNRYNKEIDAIADADKASKVKTKYALRIQAFNGTGPTRTALHVGNYDDITTTGVPAPEIPTVKSPGVTTTPAQTVDAKASATKTFSQLMKAPLLESGKAATVEVALSSPTEAASQLLSQPSSGTSKPTTRSLFQTTFDDALTKPLLSTSNPAETIEPLPVAIDLDEVKPGYIDLKATSVDRGDSLSVESTLYKIVSPIDPPSDANTTKPADSSKTAPDLKQVDSSKQDFTIERMNLSYSLSANAIFVNQFGTGRVGKKDVHSHSFSPAPSASLTVHYRPRWIKDRIEPSVLTWLVDNVDPGLGLNVAALNFDKSGGSTALGVGVGVQGSFFHDILQIGYGYNLSTSTRPQYWYVGIGIFETMNQLGKAVSIKN